jgi:glycosyltransferase involved in cell wall biosynthesis
VIRDREGGILVPPADSAALAAAMHEMLGLSEFERQRRRKAARLAASPFSTQAMAEKTLCVYMDVSR